MGKTLHIISLDIPYPPDYGGVIDIFYKLKSLHKLGIEIILHCFQYGSREPNVILNSFCKQVYYYKRTNGIKGLHFSLPYIVSSRDNKLLLQNLLLDDHPILFEGIHTTFFAKHPLLCKRYKILRAHNVESEYYQELANNTSSFFKKIYYQQESRRLLRYENNLDSFNAILSISEKDLLFFKKKYPSIQHLYIPAFHPSTNIETKPGIGKYCLYHGNLSVAENDKSVKFLALEIFNELQIPLIIAGKNPPTSLLSLQNNHIQIIANPDESTLKELIQNAHINVLPGFQKTGLKLKLLHALFIGRHCLVNQNVESSLHETVVYASNKEAYIRLIQELMQKEFSKDDLEKRKKCLSFFDNNQQAKQIESLLSTA